jgi:UDP-N-acetylmuramoyl-tripeptide--D-alanyl-D-alanine ligase
VKIKLEELLRVINGECTGFKTNYIEDFVIDSRKIKKGSLFFAIKGKKTDGHLFLKEAYEKGATGAVVEKDVAFRNDKFLIIKTASVKEALFKLGKYVRSRLSGSVIGITGSAGKTTTKEMISAVLGNSFKISKTPGNANTEFSIPLFFLNIAKAESDFHIVEMGIQKTGDMDLLNEIVRPDTAVLLNAGMSHLQYLGNVENVAKEKFKLASFVDKNNGIVVVNGDDSYFRTFSQSLSNKPLFFGLSHSNKISARIKSIDVDRMSILIYVDGNEFSMDYPFSGISFAYDILATITVAYKARISVPEILSTLSNFSPIQGRGSEIMLPDSRLLIDETYNSNPLSFEFSLSRFKNHTRPLFIILGDMLELGNESEEGHRYIGKVISSFRPDMVLATGSYSKFTVEEIRNRGIRNTFYFSVKKELLTFLQSDIEIPPHSVIFIKGSRGMHMEDAIKIIKEKLKYE